MAANQIKGYYESVSKLTSTAFAIASKGRHARVAVESSMRGSVAASRVVHRPEE
jgi:hypothetical protein